MLRQPFLFVVLESCAVDANIKLLTEGWPVEDVPLSVRGRASYRVQKSLVRTQLEGETFNACKFHLRKQAHICGGYSRWVDGACV